MIIVTCKIFKKNGAGFMKKAVRGKVSSPKIVLRDTAIGFPLPC